MKNLLGDRPDKKLNGRLFASAAFVDNEDIRDKKILDIGCGFGWCELNFIDRGVGKITATEISEKDIETAKKNVKSEKVEYAVASATDLPFKDEAFDTVVCWEVIEHIPKNTEHLLFSEVKRVLKPGGSFYLSTPNATLFSNILDPAWWLIGHRHYSEKKLVAMARKNNFSVTKKQIRGGWWTLFSDIDMYICKWLFRRRGVLQEIMERKKTEEYARNSGFINLFVKLRCRD
jgi:SAM-dependent methyltransferase